MVESLAQAELNYLQSDYVLIVIENSDEKVFHMIDRSNDLNVLEDISKMLKEEHGQENMIIKKNGEYKLFTHPIIGDGGDAHFRR